ncbi:MAG: hypothetical protein AB1792_10420 [Candidatus Zixiibacteriota bacterium]
MKPVRLILLAAAVTATPAVGVRAAALSSPPAHRPYAAAIDNRSYIGVNNLQMLVSNVGTFAYDPTGYFGKTDGLYFPRGTNNTVIFGAGIWIGAKVNAEPRVTLAEASTEFSPGGMDDGTFVPDQGRFRVYKINRGDDAAGNPDYANWPFADGAPALKNSAGGDSLDGSGNRIPLILGDQTLWSVYNDADPGAHTHRAGSTAPLGVEVQQTTFAYGRGGALGNTIYIKFLIINKGSNRLDETYISLWCDADVGDAGDDLVGCDTTLSLGFAYNEGPDQTYGEGVPAVGFDFLQGPMVPAPGDSAYQQGRWIPGYRNLPMTSFNKYVNGTDPTNALETYNYMRGLFPNGDPVVDPEGDTTLFQVPGDPVTGAGWLDVNAGDRRFMMNCGPLVMAPGDTQEVVAAVIVGQSTDALSSITDLRDKDRKAQSVFDLSFNIPFPPPAPTVWFQPLANRVELIWGQEAEGDVQESGVLGQRFVMEGYNVYQGTSIAGPWKKIATFDLEDGITRIYRDEFDAQIGATQRVLVQSGSDNGLRNNLTIPSDYIAGGGLVNHRPYYFAVTAYSYDENSVEEYRVGPNLLGSLSEVLEGRIRGIEIIPNSNALELIDSAQHVEGQSEGLVTVRVLEPTQVTGDDYAVTFNADLSWNLDNLTSGARLLADQTNSSGDYTYPLTEGLMVQVAGPDPGTKDVEWSGGNAWVTGVNWGGGFFHGGIDAGMNFWSSSIQDPTQLVNVELRFSPTTTQTAYRYLRGASPNYQYAGMGTVPLTAWDVSHDPPRQLNVCFVEQVNLASANNAWLPPDEDPVTGGREYLFIMNSDYAETPDEYYTTRSIYFDADDMDVLYAWWPTVAEGHSNAELADGQVLRFTVARYNKPGDRFTFTAPSIEIASGESAGPSLSNVHPVPNPYFHRTDLESDPNHRMIKFVNIPAGEATLEIYNLAGELIRRVAKDDPVASYVTWDVLTTSGLPPASGLFIWRLTAPGLKARVGKLAIFTEREKLKQF